MPQALCPLQKDLLQRWASPSSTLQTATMSSWARKRLVRSKLHPHPRNRPGPPVPSRIAHWKCTLETIDRPLLPSPSHSRRAEAPLKLWHRDWSTLECPKCQQEQYYRGNKWTVRGELQLHSWLALFFLKGTLGWRACFWWTPGFESTGVEGKSPFVRENTLRPHASSPALFFYGAHSPTDPQARASKEGACVRDTPGVFSEPTPL